MLEYFKSQMDFGSQVSSMKDSAIQDRHRSTSQNSQESMTKDLFSEGTFAENQSVPQTVGTIQNSYADADYVDGNVRQIKTGGVSFRPGTI